MTYDNTWWWWCFLMMNRHTDNANIRVPLRQKSEILWRIIWEISCVMFGDKNWSRTCWLRHHLIRCFIFILKAASTAQAGSNKTTFPRVGHRWWWAWLMLAPVRVRLLLLPHSSTNRSQVTLTPHTHTDPSALLHSSLQGQSHWGMFQ